MTKSCKYLIGIFDILEYLQQPIPPGPSENTFARHKKTAGVLFLTKHLPAINKKCLLFIILEEEYAIPTQTPLAINRARPISLFALACCFLGVICVTIAPFKIEAERLIRLSETVFRRPLFVNPCRPHQTTEKRIKHHGKCKQNRCRRHCSP